MNFSHCLNDSQVIYLDAQKLMSTLEMPKLAEFYIRFIVHLNLLNFIECHYKWF